MLDPAYCRRRQRRLLDVLQRRRLDAAVLTRREHVYYFGGRLPFWLHAAGFVLFADGRAMLLWANDPPAGDLPVDEVRTFEATWMGTQRQEQDPLVADLVRGLLDERRCRRVGLDALPWRVDQAAAAADIDVESVEFDLYDLRRRKDPDELALMRRAIDCTRAMHARAREVVVPGVPELRVFTELHAAAVEAAGEPLAPMHLGNDYRCNAGGGPPRGGHVAREGELYILDVGPAYRGYFADNSRAYAVGGKPTDAQHRAWQTVTGVFPIVERLARPGVRCREIFAAVDAHYRERTGQGLPHHLGHGVGLQPHESPHLNPKWDDVLREGEVFTCEPGLYAPELAAGLRVENQYLVTADGVENLTPFPMELA